jgi:ubiquinone biosynthesis protein
MISTVKNIWRLARAGRTMARYDFFLQPDQVSDLPWFARALLKTTKFGAAAPIVDSGSGDRSALSLGRATSSLGNSSPPALDVIGAKRAFELKSLQDRLPPFSMAEARETISTPVRALKSC